jgi:hypothetical protein
VSEIHKLEQEIMQIEETLFVLDNELERTRIETLHTERVLKLVRQNLDVLKSFGVVTNLETYRRVVLEKKFLEDKFLNITRVEKEIEKKISVLEKMVFQKENKKTELLNKISLDKVLPFRRKNA